MIKIGDAKPVRPWWRMNLKDCHPEIRTVAVAVLSQTILGAKRCEKPMFARQERKILRQTTGMIGAATRQETSRVVPQLNPLRPRVETGKYQESKHF